MKLFSISAGIAVCICSNLQLLGQTTADVIATVRYSNGQTVAWANLSDVVGVQPDESISVTVQFSSDLAGSTFEVSALDGSRITESSKVVAADGTLSFAFRATGNPGTNRINLRRGTALLVLKFWVLNLQNPQNNPPVITPANPEN